MSDDMLLDDWALFESPAMLDKHTAFRQASANDMLEACFATRTSLMDKIGRLLLFSGDCLYHKA